MAFCIEDRGLDHALELRRGICEFHEVAPAEVDMRLRFSSDFLSDLVAQKVRWPEGIEQGRVQVEGDRALVPQFFSSFEPPMAPKDIKLVSR